MLRRTTIINNVPGPYSRILVFPTIIAQLGMNRYGLDLEGKWWDVSHNVSGMHVDSMNLEEKDAEALKLMKRKLYSWGAYEYYGDRHIQLYDDEAMVLKRHCHGLDKDYHGECVREYGATRILDFNDIRDPYHWKNPIERIVSKTLSDSWNDSI